MTPESIVAIVGGLVALVAIVFIVIRKLPKRLKTVHYTRKWRDLQKLCRDKSTWPAAITDADDLFEEALNKRKKSGKTIGEMMVSAEADFSDKEAIWKAHKLAAHIKDKESNPSLKESDVKQALVAFRQALRDLGAF